MIRYASFDTALGRAYATADDADALTGFYFEGARHAPPIASAWRRCEPYEPPFAACLRELDEYFAGTRRAFGLVMAPRGTPFQQRVWQAIARIPYGQTVSYTALATEAGAPGAARAAGAATGRNPLSILVPCHRVVGAAGALTGYAGGLDRKTHLLVLEGARTAVAA
jgi:methylated-DNA-[protein]-cysteine S-methyltransferase